MGHGDTLGHVELLTLRYGDRDIDRIYSSCPSHTRPRSRKLTLNEVTSEIRVLPCLIMFSQTVDRSPLKSDASLRLERVMGPNLVNASPPVAILLSAGLHSAAARISSHNHQYYWGQSMKRAVNEINSGLKPLQAIKHESAQRSTTSTRGCNRQVSSFFTHTPLSESCCSSQRRDESSFSAGEMCPRRHS